MKVKAVCFGSAQPLILSPLYLCKYVFNMFSVSGQLRSYRRINAF